MSIEKLSIESCHELEQMIINEVSVVWNGVDPERYNSKKCKSEDVEVIRSRYGIKPEEKMIFSWKIDMVEGDNKPSSSYAHVLEEYPNAQLVILGK